MSRGRRPAKNAEEFNAMVRALLSRRELLGLTLTGLAKASNVNRGTLSEFFSGRRKGFGYEDRLKLLKQYPSHFGPDAEERFLEGKHRRKVQSSLISLDPPASPHTLLEKGQQLLFCASFPEAMQEFEAVYKLAAEQRAYALQADAAARMTYQQAQEKHWQVRKGERATTIFFTKPFEVEDDESR